MKSLQSDSVFDKKKTEHMKLNAYCISFFVIKLLIR